MKKNDKMLYKAKSIHGDKYDYSKFEYINSRTKVCVICHKHGEFLQRIDHHLKGSGCPKCAGVASVSFDEFSTRAKNKHNNFYSYIENTYINTGSKVGIVCPKHGVFYQLVSSHLLGCGCPKCNGGIRLDVDSYISKAKKIHGNYYDYSMVEYVNAKTKVKIICPRHGVFLQEADSHLCGKGCPKCKSSILENMVMNSLNKNNILYDYQYKISEMGKKSYDFYLPSFNLIIECQGEQHFSPVNFSSRMSDDEQLNFFNERINLDYHKYNAAINNGIDIVYFTNYSFFKQKNINIDLPFYKDKKLFQHTDELIKFIKTRPESVNIDENILLFKEFLGNISDGFVYHDGYFINKNYKIYLVDCKKNDRDSLNSISRVDRKRHYKSIFIFKDEFFYKKHIIKNKLSHILNKNENLHKVGGRKVIIREIEHNVSSDFLNEFHIQGGGQKTLSIGAFYNDKLIGVMSFKKLNNNKNNYDLTRFATDYNYVCQGVASKMLSYFIREYNPDSIISFADRRWTVDKNCNLYTKIGFKLVGKNEPDYKYHNEKVDKYKRFHKFGFRKQILHKKYGLDLSLTETEMVKILGYDRIWDCGLFKYEWKREF